MAVTGDAGKTFRFPVVKFVSVTVICPATVPCWMFGSGAAGAVAPLATVKVNFVSPEANRRAGSTYVAGTPAALGTKLSVRTPCKSLGAGLANCNVGLSGSVGVAVAFNPPIVIAGSGYTRTKETMFDVTPLETTEICAEPGLWLKLPGTFAVSWLELSNFVESGVPFHCTTEFELKPPPFTVSWNGWPEEGALGGLNELIEVTDTIKFRALELTPLMMTVI